MLKLGTLSVLALLNVLMQGWLWTHDLTETMIAMGIGAAALLNFLGAICIYSETQSRPLLLGLCTVPGIAIFNAVL